jgi:hypothetical protein
VVAISGTDVDRAFAIAHRNGIHGCAEYLTIKTIGLPE